ncbi:MAG: riboflavin kinase/FMN adenylyltransferase [Alphaproteobacteria bacterium]|jgi:riboflavin kinase/FMN adenylyltransferase|tara:strand:- start:30084 stop:31025 length:942 start_codon:yes stop_codon:yes gene_type:complete
MVAMEIINSYKNIPKRLQGGVVALGNFDGVHLGHRVLLKETIKLAYELNVFPGVMTFAPHPKKFFQPENSFFQLTNSQQQSEIISKMGIGVIYEIIFNEQLSKMLPQEFVEEVLIGGLNVGHLVVGWNFKFGSRRIGNIDTLRELCNSHSIGLSVVDPETDNKNTLYSSTRIREDIANGNIESAAKTLGYNWSVSGKVISGDKRGRDLGFPTINMELDDGIILLPGIYATFVFIDDKKYKSISYYGDRPTYDGKNILLETFLFDFDEDLYDSLVKVEFISFLRGDQYFDKSEDLRLQMSLDCSKALAILKNYE